MQATTTRPGALMLFAQLADEVQEPMDVSTAGNSSGITWIEMVCQEPGATILPLGKQTSMKPRHDYGQSF